MSVEEAPSRERALAVLVITFLLAAAAWLFIRRATESGLNRLERLDVVRAYCDSLRAGSRGAEDSVRIGMIPLRDTIDAQSDDAIRTCGDLTKN